MLGLAANKGGVAIRFVYKDSSMVFVASHLAAHKYKCDKRNEDWKNISQKIGYLFFLVYTTNVGAYFHDVDHMKFRFYNSEIPDKKLVMSDHDFVWWMGDLNYR